MASPALTPDQTKYYTLDFTTKARTTLWSESRYVISHNFAWNQAAPVFVFNAPLRGVELTPTGNFTITTSLADVPDPMSSDTRSTPCVPSGLARCVFKIDGSQGEDILLPYSQVCINDWKKARILSHNFELPQDSGVIQDTLEAAGHKNDVSGLQTYTVFTSSFGNDSLGAGTTLSSTGTLDSHTSDLNPDSVVLHLSQTSNEISGDKSHYRRVSFSSGEGKLSFSSKTLLPTKFLFDATVIADTGSSNPDVDPACYFNPGHTTNPNGTSNYIELLGGDAPYQITVKKLIALNTVTGDNLDPTTILYNSVSSDARPQLLLGFTSDPQEASPKPVSSSWSTPDITGCGWVYQVASSRVYIKSGVNSGFFRLPTGVSSIDISLQIEVRDSSANGDFANGAVSTITCKLPLRQAPVSPQIVDPKSVLRTGDFYNFYLGRTSNDKLLTGYPYTEPNSAELFKSSVPWWRPSIFPAWRGNYTLDSKYLSGDVVSYNSKAFYAVTGSIGVPPIPSTSWVIVGYSAALAWDPDATYQIDAIVSKNGLTFRALRPSTNLDPLSGVWIETLSDQVYFQMICNRSLPQGGPVQPILSEKFPVYRDGSCFDYVEIQRKLHPFIVSGDLALQAPDWYPTGSITYLTSEVVNIPLAVYGGSALYTWTLICNNNHIQEGQEICPGITFSVLNNSTQLIISGARTVSSSDVFPESLQISVSVMDSSGSNTSSLGSEYNLVKSINFTLRFTTEQIIPVAEASYLRSEFKVVAPTTSSLRRVSEEMISPIFPWARSSYAYDYLNNFSDGLIPGGAVRGFISTTSSNYTMEVVNTSPELWKSFKYRMPLGLSFGVQRLNTGGYTTLNSYQISNSSSALGSIVRYTPSGFVISESTVIPDANGKPMGFKFTGLPLCVGDIYVSAVSQVGALKDQIWELGFKAPHFEFIDRSSDPAYVSGQTLNPRDSVRDPNFIKACGIQGYTPSDSVALGIEPIYIYNQSENCLKYFKTTLDSGCFDSGCFDSYYKAASESVIPVVGGGSDTLRIKVTQEAQVNAYQEWNLQLPILEKDTAKFWFTWANSYGNPNYYWLGSTSYTKVYVDINSTPIYYGFTECDRLLKKGVFPDPSSVLSPSVIKSLVNFYLESADGSQHSLNAELHEDVSFIKALENLVLGTPDTASFKWTDLNTHIDNPFLDTNSLKTFLGPKSKGSMLPDGSSTFSHPTLTYIDRGFRVSQKLDALALWTLLNSKGVEINAKLHVAMVFLVTRPNIDLSSDEAKNSLDISLIKNASGLTDTQLDSQILRGKSYVRVPIHLEIINGSNERVTLDPRDTSWASKVISKPV